MAGRGKLFFFLCINRDRGETGFDRLLAIPMM